MYMYMYDIFTSIQSLIMVLCIHCVQIRLFNHFQLELPSYWLRYSERIVEEMVNATFSLLSLTYANPLMLGPVHLLALLDPSCNWLKKWMVRLVRFLAGMCYVTYMCVCVILYSTGSMAEVLC